jgi:hypothetical protein
MTGMVERVARAIYEAHGVYEPREKPWGSVSQAVKSDYLCEARAAIAAMGEPTEEMMRAGARQTGAPDCIWRAMIDEALRDK